MAEKGLNRFKEHEKLEDLNNQENARLSLMAYFNVDVKPQDEMSIWDWEFFKDNKLVALGEYRRRFCNSYTYNDFQFSKKKFDTMKLEAKKRGVPAFMFVEFNDNFLYFKIQGDPPVRIMRRNHEIRTEDCVCISNYAFRQVYKFDVQKH